MRIVAIVPCFNESVKLGRVLSRLSEAKKKFQFSFRIVVVNDGSTDNSVSLAARHRVDAVVHLVRRQGVGEALRRGFSEVRNLADVVVVMAGNDKDDPEQIPDLLAPILRGEADFVRGSRFLPGGQSAGLPAYRALGIRVLSRLASFCSGTRVTDATNGFCAFRRELLAEDAIGGTLHLGTELPESKKWLAGYSLEPFFWMEAIRRGFQVREVPVSKIYPPKQEGYTKMRPWSGWWALARPLLAVSRPNRGRA